MIDHADSSSGGWPSTGQSMDVLKQNKNMGIYQYLLIKCFAISHLTSSLRARVGCFYQFLKEITRAYRVVNYTTYLQEVR